MSHDEFETKYMEGGKALARSRASMPIWVHALIALAFAAVVWSAIAHARATALVGLPILLFTWLLFMVLRVTVTAETVHVQLGLFGPKIPIADILEVTAGDYPAMKYRGWGLRVGIDGSVAYSVPGQRRGISIHYKKKNGRHAKVWVSSPNPEELVAAIQRVQASTEAHAGARLRVDVDKPLLEEASGEDATTDERERDVDR